MGIEDVSMLFTFIGGLGMFLYGMHIMAEGLQHFAGGRMQKLMGFLTQNRIMAILVGTLVTAVIQSSSATTVMVVGFVNAGMLNLSSGGGSDHGRQYRHHCDGLDRFHERMGGACSNPNFLRRFSSESARL